MREQLLYYAIKYHGEYARIKEAINGNEYWQRIDYDADYVTIEDDLYPDKLRRLTYAPYILFYEGDITLLKDAAIALIGAREASAFGLQMCRIITNVLKTKYVIISGLAKGIDACAHREALQYKTIGVIGCGLDIIYPKVNQSLYDNMREYQLIISEYPKSTKPFASHFPWRNRIIAALSNHIIVVEAAKRSGTLLTVNEALALDIPVSCVPHDCMKAQGEGCNLLISQGADIILDEEDIRRI